MRTVRDAKEERDIIELDFGPTLNIFKEEYLDVYEGIQSELLNTTRFDKNSDLSTTYLGKMVRSKNDIHSTLHIIKKICRDFPSLNSKQ